jgi:hypothetical protein
MRWLRRTRVGLVLALVVDLLTYGGRYRETHVSSSSLAAALAVQAQVTEEWMALRGVVGTAVGMDGRGEAVLKVYLTAPGVALLPARVAGVDVSLEVTGPIVALDEPPAGSVDPKGGFPRPVPIGVSTGHPNVTAGTIGARVTDGNRVYALSNNHVYAANNQGRTGDNILQPGVVDGGRDPEDAVGTLYAYEPIAFCASLRCPSNRIDAALALTTPEDLGTETPEDGYGSPRTSTTEAELGMSVQKYGRTTGFTQGRITGINAVIDVSYRTGTARFENQVMITGDGFSAGGDSGSLIVSRGVLFTDRRPVGLLFAGSPTNTIANPIDLVLTKFGVRIEGGS